MTKLDDGYFPPDTKMQVMDVILGLWEIVPDEDVDDCEKDINRLMEYLGWGTLDEYLGSLKPTAVIGVRRIIE